MPDELTRFQTKGPSWSERAQLGELKAVLSPMASERRNLFLHSVNLYAARLAMQLSPDVEMIVDFGCGTGRFVRFFGAQNRTVIGTEVTKEMLQKASELGLPPRCLLVLTDGITLPMPDSCIDLIWCCGVLRYSLFVPNPVYREIAREMYRTLRPGGLVLNVEMYVDTEPGVFTRDFELEGFATERIYVMQRYHSRLEKACQSPRLPVSLVSRLGHFCAWYRCHFDNPHRSLMGLRDYLFLWKKPVQP